MAMRGCWSLLVLLPAFVILATAPAEDRGVPDDRLVDWVDDRVAEWQPTAAERRFDDIGWATEIRQAERLSRRSGRPVFLFTHDGRIAIGRC